MPGKLQRFQPVIKQNNALWTILCTDESGLTVQQFYDDKITGELQKHGVVSEMQLESAFLGKSKDSLDKIDLSLPLDSAIHLFGPFLRYQTCEQPQLRQVPAARDAFSVLMANRKQQSLPGLPESVQVRTKKDRLYNDFLELLKEEHVLFPAGDVNSSSKNFVKTAVDCLWYLDGHHEKLKKQSCPVPRLFERFSGYNTPELSKHRKRQSSNLSSSVLNSLSSSLFSNLQASFWSDSLFRRLHEQTRFLAQSMAGYADYLSSQNKAMKTIHTRSVPVRQLTDALSIQYVCAPK